jgi:integrase
VTRRGERRWVIDISYRTVDGKQERYRRDAQVQLKKAADAEHRRLEDQLAKFGSLMHLMEPPEPTAGPVTFAEAVRHYRATSMKTALKPSTRIGYNSWFDTVLLPRFGAWPLTDIDRTALEKLDAELVDEGLAPGTRAKGQIALRSVLRTAVDAGMLELMPPLPGLPKSSRKEVNPMRRADFEAILAAAAPSARLAFQLAAFAGLRAGEVRGLRWPDIDWVAKTLTIRRSVSSGFETTPKSHHQRRIPLSRVLLAELEAAKLAKVNPWSQVSLTRAGRPWGESGLNQAFKRALERSGRDGWTFHDLRHFFVSELFRAGVSAEAIRILAGHADLTTTQRYADLDANDLRAAIERIDGNAMETSKTEVATDS